MDTDHLLTDYKQKCNELKNIERENIAFRQQVEQMLQKLSPLEKCEEELGSVKAELEEKKSSLKIYQETHLEYLRVKEAVGKSETMKKKLEAKVKKLEKATEKHNQDFRQLKEEKKILEKELKKAKEKIESFPSENKRKVVKHVETQSERVWPITDLDKEKIKLLLEELWLCIDGSTGKSHINRNNHLEAVQNPTKPKRTRGKRPSRCSSPETRTTQTSLTSLQIKLDGRPDRHVGQMENETMETSKACTNDGTADQCQPPAFAVEIEPPARSCELFHKEPEEAGEDLTEILKWVRPLPRLLSPIQVSSAANADMSFEELSDSSDEEMEQDAQLVENILENLNQSTPEAYAASRKNSTEPPSEYDSSGVNTENIGLRELPVGPAVLKHNESVQCSDPLAKSGFPNKIGAESRDAEKHLEENCEFMERNPEISVNSTENVAKSTADLRETEKKTLVCDLTPATCLQEQEKTVEPRHMQEVVTNSFGQMLNASSNLIKEEKKEELSGTVEASMSSLTEDDQPPARKSCSPQQTEEPVLATENVLVIPGKDGSSSVIQVAVMKEGSQDIQTGSDWGRARLLTEHTAPAQNRTEELCTQHNSEPEFADRGIHLDYFKLHSETDDHIDQAPREHAEVELTQPIEKDVCASVTLYWAEENYSTKDGCHKDSESDINEKTKLDSVDALAPKLNITQAVDGWENSLSFSSELFQTRNEYSTPPFASKNEEGDKLKTEVEHIANKDKMAESVLEETLSLAIAKGCLRLEDHLDQIDSSQSLQEEPGNTNVPVLPIQVPVIQDGLSQTEGPVKTNPEFPLTRSLSELEPFEDPSDKLECAPIVHNVSNSIQSVGVIVEDKCLTSASLGEDGDEPLKITTVGTPRLATAVECEKGATSGVVMLERPVQSCLVTGTSPNNAPSQEMAEPSEKSMSPKPWKRSLEDTGMNECSGTYEATLEETPNGSSAQSMQDALQEENGDPKAVSPVMLTITSESPTTLLFGRNGPGCDVVANGQSSDSLFIAPSAGADPTDHCNNKECLMGEGAETKCSEESRHKSLDHCSHKDQDEVEVKRAGEQSTSSESGAPVYVKGCCDVNNSEERFEGHGPNNASTAHTSAANQAIVSKDQGLITASSDKIGSPSKGYPIEHLNEAVLEDTNKILTSEVRSGEADQIKTPGDAVSLLDVSASSSSEEEYPLRRVNPPKKYSRLLAFKEELGTAQNNPADVPSNMIVSSGIQGLLHLAESASREVEQAHNSEQACMEHSYAAPWNSGKGFSALEASVSEDKEAGERVALTSRSEVDNKEPASEKLSASDLEVNGVTLSPEAELSGTIAEPSAAYSTWSAKQERTSAALGWSSAMAQSHLTPHHFDGGTNTSLEEEDHVEKDWEILAAVTSENSISVDSSLEKQEVVSQKSELLIKSSEQSGAERAHKPSDLINVSAKVGAEGGGKLLPKIPGRTGGRKTRQDSLAETVVAHAYASTVMKHFPKTLTKMRQEMGPPLPPLLPPLIATPPRTVQPFSSIMPSSSQVSLPSPLNELISPLRETLVPPQMLPLLDIPKHKSPAVHASPSPSEVLIGERTLSSPLQFCATTPKHALPVPGRFPPSAASSATPAVPQENSVKILDSMYPELSARAITLNILKGNIQLSRPSSMDSKNVPPPVHQISSFKEITSSSTAFVKTGTALFSELPSSNVSETGKRTLASPAMPKSAKRLRLDSELLKSDLSREELSGGGLDAGAQGSAEESPCLSSEDAVLSVDDSRLLLPVEEVDPDNKAVMVALEKVSESCFDLFPVIHSRVHVGNTSSIPVMTEEEEEVVYEFGITKKCLAEQLLLAILKKLKYQKTSLGPCLIQSLCRVYVGICRQLRDLEKARLFCYSLLKEDFPQSGKLILFMGNMWSEIFASGGVISQAIQLVARKRSKGHVLKCLKTVLNWEESGPANIGMTISRWLLAIQQCPEMEFQASEQHGEDLKENLWDYVFAIDLLCSHQKWGWTHDHIISKELWPIMDKWIKNRQGSGNASSSSDVITATVLRLIGRLSQIGLKEGFSSAVKNISSVIGAFLQHAKEKDVPWGVQLAAAYALCELGPSSPSEILEALQAWEAGNGNSLPPAVTSSISEVRGLLKQ